MLQPSPHPGISNQVRRVLCRPFPSQVHPSLVLRMVLVGSGKTEALDLTTLPQSRGASISRFCALQILCRADCTRMTKRHVRRFPQLPAKSDHNFCTRLTPNTPTFTVIGETKRKLTSPPTEVRHLDRGAQSIRALHRSCGVWFSAVQCGVNVGI